MTCIEAQSLITSYVNDELNISELEDFLEHVNSCPSCREELGVYYALLTAMKQLDEDRNLSADYNQELEDKLHRSQERIVHVKYVYYRKKGILIFLFILLAAFFGLKDYTARIEDNPVKESTFRLRVTYNKARFEELTDGLELYLNSHMQEESREAQ
jgi:hypothetical protein